MEQTPPLHVETPLVRRSRENIWIRGENILGKILCVYSGPLSAVLGREVYLKLDNLQPGGSFKIRGIGRTMTEAAARGATVFIGGEAAALATAHH